MKEERLEEFAPDTLPDLKSAILVEQTRLGQGLRHFHESTYIP